ncbi:metalloregulator ArsR/SmtB family transcription factor [[Eubacterium] cellulosolvens]
MFKALSSPTRLEILKSLMRKEMHVSAIARQMKISVPVAAKHVKILEKAGLVEKKEFGRSHVYKAKRDRFYKILEPLCETSQINISRGKSVLDALKSTCIVNTKRINDKELLVSIDGKDGYYLYEVNGKLADTPMDRYKLRNDSELKLKKLIPITEKRIVIKLR